MLNFCGIVVAILKIESGRNFSMSGINSGRWNRTMLNLCAVLWWPFWKYWPIEIFRCKESIRDIIIYPHMKWRSNRTMLNLCGIVVAILKMATGRTCSMLGHHYLPTYQILMISDNAEYLPPIFYAVFWQPFCKWQTSRKFWTCRIAPLMMAYHYVKFDVSISLFI